MNFFISQGNLQRSCLSKRVILSTKYRSAVPQRRAIAGLVVIRALATTAAHTIVSSGAPIYTDGSSTMPPGHKATVGHLTTFYLPQTVTGDPADHRLGKEMVDAWRRDGIFQVAMTPPQEKVCEEALTKSKNFFKQPQKWKASHVDSQSFAGYIASGEELTDGIADYSEIFTITKDLPESDSRVQAKWPCHGPCPWPSQEYKHAMENLMNQLGENGEKLLKLAALGLGLDRDTLTQLTDDGWHHMRILRWVLPYILIWNLTEC